MRVREKLSVCDGLRLHIQDRKRLTRTLIVYRMVICLED